MGPLTPTSSGSSVLVPSPASQGPLLPPPTLVQKPQHSASQFTEKFDFVAMNEKFKKDEVWSSLGKAATKIEGVEDTECYGIPNPKSAYKKDDFFDTIFCNSLTRGSRNGQNRLSERMKLDTEACKVQTHSTKIAEYVIILKLQGIIDVMFICFLFRHLAISNGGLLLVMVAMVGDGGYGAGRAENVSGLYNWGRSYGNGGRGRGPGLSF